MSIERTIREKIKSLDIDMPKKADATGVELSVCQFIVVILSIVSVIFLFLPILFLNNLLLLVLFFSISLLAMGVGVWFWVKKRVICESPEEYD